MQLESIAKGTAQLAEQGNANALTIIEQLNKRGITVDSNTASSQ